MSNKRGSHPKVSSVSHESIRTHDRAQARARMHQRATLPLSHTHAFTQIRTKTHKNSDLHEPLHLVCGQIDARLSRLCDLCGLAKFSCNAFPLPNVIPARRSDTDDEPGTRADSRATASCPRRQAYADRYRFSWHPEMRRPHRETGHGRLREGREREERVPRAFPLLGKQGLLGAMDWRMQVLALSILAALQPARSFLLQKPALSGVHSSRGSVAAVRGCCVQRGWSKVNFPLCMLGQPNGATTCVVATRHGDDVASRVMADALKRRVAWERVPPPEVAEEGWGELWQCASASHIFLWERSDSMLQMDRIDETFAALTGQQATDFIFISKHASASGSATLTVRVPLLSLRAFMFLSDAWSMLIVFVLCTCTMLCRRT